MPRKMLVEQKDDVAILTETTTEDELQLQELVKDKPQPDTR